MDKNLEAFFGEIKTSVSSQSFIRLLLSKAITGDNVPERINIRLVDIKQEKRLNFVYEFKTRHVTRNFTIEEALSFFQEELGSHFKNAVLFTTSNDIRLSYNKKRESKLDYSNATCTTGCTNVHDHEKNRLLSLENSLYLRELGVIGFNGQPMQNMQGKYRQINKYIETIEAIIRNSELADAPSISVADMGSGKGYLTFAIYDYITNNLKKKCLAVGVEIRPDLVDTCNKIAEKCGFENLKFHRGDIRSYPTEKTDILIALHACDTATDDAIFQGITSGASIIITAPCCHKQIRKELNTHDELALITKHGILEERQAEILTDTLRGLFLEAYNYKTRIFEFIADAHTHKNVMISGIKMKKQTMAPAGKLTEQALSLMTLFGIKRFYLAELLNGKTK